MTNLDDLIKREVPEILKTMRPILLYGTHAQPAVVAVLRNEDLRNHLYTNNNVIPYVWAMKVTDEDKKQYHCIDCNIQENYKKW